MSASPTKESVPTLAPPNATALHAPPSPRSHRALRRLQSAHTLGSNSRTNNQPSLISQQRQVQRTFTPAPSDLGNTIAPSANHRGRSNSDAAVMNFTEKGPAGRRQAAGRKLIGAESLSLDRLIRDGPTDGDLAGGLESMRLKILDQGIKSDSDGMVALLPLSSFTSLRAKDFTNLSAVFITHLHLAYIA